jgi:hypothetical protein
LAGALKRGELSPPYREAALVASIGDAAAASEIAAALNAVDARGVGPDALVLALEVAAAADQGRSEPDLVWSGPEVDGLHARDTRRVYEELVGSAKRSLWASSYVVHDGPRTFKLLAERMEAVPDLDVVLLLNIGRKWGDTTKADDLVHAFTDKFWSTEWPGIRRPDVFYDPRALEHGEGVLHAKAVIADRQSVLITSANLTEAAFDRNIEVGLLARNRSLAESLAKHFRVLIEKEMLRALPSPG